MIEISEIMQQCFRNGIKVYPICKDRKWKIQSEVNGRKKTFDKALSGYKEINEAMRLTYEYYYKKYMK